MFCSDFNVCIGGEENAGFGSAVKVVLQSRGAALAPVYINPSALSVLQGYFAAASEILKHLKERFPPNSQHAQVECHLACESCNYCTTGSEFHCIGILFSVCLRLYIG